MPLIVSPTLAATLGNATSGLPLQAGTVVAARVQQAIEAGLTRLLIAGIAVDVASPIALKPGTHLQLAVSQTPEAIEFAIVGQGRSAATAVSNARADIPDGSNAVVLRAPLVPQAERVASNSAAAPQVAARAASPEQAVKAVLTETVQTEAPRQASLAPLFANVSAATSLKSLPPDVVAKAAQLLALRPELGGRLTADDIQQAFKSSGLFLEQNLKAMVQSPAMNAAPPPDLKAALLVFRQVLATWSQTLPEAALPAGAPQASNNATPATAGPSPQIASSLASAPKLASSPSIVPQASADASQGKSATAPVAAPDGLPKNGLPQTQDAALVKFLAAAFDADPLKAFVSNIRTAAQNPDVRMPAAPHAELPQPPFRGAAPSVQPVAQASVTAMSSQNEIAGTLLRETDAALARQTLHQIASLPDRVDVTLPRVEANTPRWSFEIPFATPQGTAVAQFEISADGGGNGEKTSMKDRVWRVRFSLDVEPAGAVHASIAMIGQGDDAPPRTSVRLWAERPDTVARLKSASDDLSQALRRAELEPGSIVIGDGAPPPNNAPRSGRFLDRAS